MSITFNSPADEKMARTVSASEAKNRLGALIQWAIKNQDEVIVESHGEPTVVIMPYGEYQKFQTVKEQVKRQALLREWEQLAQEVSSHNRDLSPEQADELADQAVREVIDDMVQEEKIKFKPS